jgi:rapamycin-insensitive companion of mTOR
LYGELVKTETGTDYLMQTQDIENFKKEILSNDIPLIKRRAALWAIGHIGSNTYGFRLVKEAKIIKEIVKLAESAEVLSLRGTCIYILGLLSKTIEGKKEI